MKLIDAYVIYTHRIDYMNLGREAPNPKRVLVSISIFIISIFIFLIFVGTTVVDRANFASLSASTIVQTGSVLR